MALQASAPLDVYKLVNHLKTIRSTPVSPGSDLEPAYNAKSFTICHIDTSGETNCLYQPDDNIATCVINSINICRSMLENQQVRNHLTEFAKDYSQECPTAWFLQEASPEHEGDMSRVTDDFLQKILEKFPIVFVTHTWENRRRMAASIRRPWDGIFNPSNQCILVNGTTLDDMVKAAKKAKRAKNDTERKGYKAFLFMEVNSLLHEIGHVFVTYLSRGRQNTPLTMKAPVYFDMDPEKGEAGRKLESLIFGGTMEYWVDPDTGTRFDECGAPYLLDTNGSRWRILPETIERTINCDFKFPYDHEKDAEIRKLDPLDVDIPIGVSSDPMTHHWWVQYQEPLPPPADS